MIKLFHNAKIFTMDDESSFKTALVVDGSSILALGGEELLSRYPNAELHDLEGRVVIPGLIDTHAHPFMAARRPSIFIPRSVCELLEDLKKRVKSARPGEWIVYSTVYPLRLDELRYPTREELDKIAPDNPVSVDGFYSARLNSCAMREMNVSCETLKNAYLISGRFYPSTSEFELERVLHGYSECGITSVVSGFSSFEEIEASKNVDSVRMRHTINLATANPETLKTDIKNAPNNDFSRVCFLKNTIDGGILTATSYMEYPYKKLSEIFSLDEDESFRGCLVTGEQALAAGFRLAESLGLSYCAHAVGSAAAKEFIRACKSAEARFDARHLLIHADFLDAEMLEEMKSLGLSLAFQPAWHYMDAPHMYDITDEREASRLLPYLAIAASFVRAGAGSDHMVGLGADDSVNPYNPFIGLYNMVTYKCRDGKKHGAVELDRTNALRYYTSRAAALTFDEDSLGSLEVGKRADFAVLSDNYFTCDSERIPHIRSLLTYVGGKEVFRAVD